MLKCAPMFEVPKRASAEMRREGEKPHPHEGGQWSPALAAAGLAMAASSIFMADGLPAALALALSVAALVRERSEAKRGDTVWAFALFALILCAISVAIHLFGLRESLAGSFTTNLQQTHTSP